MSLGIRCEQNASSESYNGAITDKLSWSQSISEVDISIDLPESITSSKDLKVLITSSHLKVEFKNQPAPYIDDDFSWKCKGSDCFWCVSKDKLLIHLQKKEERWWQKLLQSDADLDMSKMQRSLSINELPEDAQSLVQEMFWNEKQKILEKSTMEKIKKEELMKFTDDTSL